MDDGYIVSRLFVLAPELLWREKFVNGLISEGVISEEDANQYQKIARKYKSIGDLTGKQLIYRLAGFAPEFMSVSTINLLRRFDLIDVQTAHSLRIGLRAVGALQPVISNKKITKQDMFNFLEAVAKQDSIQYFRAKEQSEINKFADYLRQKNYEEALARYANDPDFQRLTGPEKAAKLQRAYRLKPGQFSSIDPLSGEDLGLVRPMITESITRFRVAASYAMFARSLYNGTKDGIEHSTNVYDAMYLVTRNLLSPEVLKRAVGLGLIQKGRYKAIVYTTMAGLDTWSKIRKASEVEGAAARMLLVGEGIVSHEMLNAMRAAGMIDEDMYKLLQPGVTAVRKAFRNKLPIQPTKIRAIPGENPLQKYKRVSGKTDRELMELLAEAARDSGKTAERLAKAAGIGGKTAGRQQRIVQAELHKQIRAYFEGAGALTIYGEKQAAAAAAEAMADIQKTIFKTKEARRLERMLRAQAASGVDSYISRMGNINELSTRVYKNYKYSKDRIDREINKALLRGLNARDFAKNVERLISPSVPGGVSYAATRLARTEINNAFHQTSIRYTIEMPWVKGYKWNLSGRHGRPDVCNEMAERDHEGLGRGVYSKRNAPAKPHPHCLCYITTVDASSKEFERAMRNGSYDAYLSQLDKSGLPGLSAPSDQILKDRDIWSNPFMQMAGNVAINTAISSPADAYASRSAAAAAADLG